MGRGSSTGVESRLCFTVSRGVEIPLGFTVSRRVESPLCLRLVQG